MARCRLRGPSSRHPFSKVPSIVPLHLYYIYIYIVPVLPHAVATPARSPSASAIALSQRDMDAGADLRAYAAGPYVEREGSTGGEGVGGGMWRWG